jgi:hypothetical protein
MRGQWIEIWAIETQMNWKGRARVKAMDAGSSKILLLAAFSLTLVFCLALLAAPSSFAQSQPAPKEYASLNDPTPPSSDPMANTAPATTNGSARQPGTSDEAEIPPAVARQLEELIARDNQLEKEIEELKAALKSRDAMAEPAPAPAASPTPASVSIDAIPKQDHAPAQPTAAAPQVPEKIAPFSDWDWTWLNGESRNKEVAFDSKFFTPEIRADVTYSYSFNKPIDNSMGGSSELFRSNEIQLEQLGVGGDFHYDNVRARFMTQFGMYSTATIRNDPSYQKGQWQIDDADRYLSEAYGGYHLNVLDGINIDAGIFMSYIGLFSYYNFDNWAYQPSYVSSNTPWFFQGIRIQIFPNPHLKIEPWIINGWQSYASSNSWKGLGGQVRWTPRPWLNIISNNYGLGHDDLYVPNRWRIHTDNSIEVKYYDKPYNTFDKMAFTFTGDLGCEYGGGVSCHGNTAGGPKQSFIGYMLYNRIWLFRDKYAFTIGGGQINNPGRYLVLIPPINGETAGSAAINSPYFNLNPGSPFKAWDTSFTFDYMPKEFLTFRWEYDYRHANVPYWSGPSGVTPPTALGAGTWANNGDPVDWACMDGSSVPAVGAFAETQTQAAATCSGTLPPFNGTANANHGGLWTPNLLRDESLIDVDIMVKF